VTPDVFFKMKFTFITWNIHRMQKFLEFRGVSI